MNLNVRSHDLITSDLRARRVRDAFTVYFNSDVGRLPENSH